MFEWCFLFSAYERLVARKLALVHRFLGWFQKGPSSGESWAIATSQKLLPKSSSESRRLILRQIFVACLLRTDFGSQKGWLLTSSHDFVDWNLGFKRGTFEEMLCISCNSRYLRSIFVFLKWFNLFAFWKTWLSMFVQPLQVIRITGLFLMFLLL